MTKRTPSKLPVKRNLSAKQAKDQKAGPMKDKREGRGGAKNVIKDVLLKDANS